MPHLEDPLLQAYLDGYCNDRRVAEIEAHLEGCEQCRRRLDDARQAASHASQLLGALEPGPVHAPSFEELEAKAAARAGGDVADEIVAKMAEAGLAKPPSVSRPFWSSPSLAWAATLAIAFALGWVSRSEIGMPVLEPAPLATFDAPASVEEVEAGGEIDALQAVVKRSAADAPQLPAEAPADAQGPAGQEEASNRPDVGGGLSTVGEQRLLEQQVAAAAPASPGRREVEPSVSADRAEAAADPSLEMNEEIAQAGAFGDAGAGDAGAGGAVGAAGGYIPVDLTAVEDWLGAPPRQLPDLQLLRAEVGPGTLMEDGSPERPVVRLVYRTDNGEQISLDQQFTGAVGGPLPAAADDRVDAAGERARAQPQQVRANRQAGFDRDVGAVGGVASEAPYVSTPGGGFTISWIDADGYVLSLSANLQPDIIRGLADRIR